MEAVKSSDGETRRHTAHDVEAVPRTVTTPKSKSVVVLTKLLFFLNVALGLVIVGLILCERPHDVHTTHMSSSTMAAQELSFGRTELPTQLEFLDSEPLSQCVNGTCAFPPGVHVGGYFYVGVEPLVSNNSVSNVCRNVVPPPDASVNATHAAEKCLELAAQGACVTPPFQAGTFPCNFAYTPSPSHGPLSHFITPYHTLSHLITPYHTLSLHSPSVRPTTSSLSPPPSPTPRQLLLAHLRHLPTARLRQRRRVLLRGQPNRPQRTGEQGPVLLQAAPTDRLRGLRR
jgi:hypothetical protein